MIQTASKLTLFATLEDSTNNRVMTRGMTMIAMRILGSSPLWSFDDVYHVFSAYTRDSERCALSSPDESRVNPVFRWFATLIWNVWSNWRLKGNGGAQENRSVDILDTERSAKRGYEFSMLLWKCDSCWNRGCRLNIASFKLIATRDQMDFNAEFILW